MKLQNFCATGVEDEVQAEGFSKTLKVQGHKRVTSFLCVFLPSFSCSSVLLKLPCFASVFIPTVSNNLYIFVLFMTAVQNY